MLRFGLKRPDQLQIECRSHIAIRCLNRLQADCCVKNLRKFFWHVHARQPVLSTLLGCLNRNLLPLRLFLRGAFRIDLHNGAIGNDRRNLGRADLDRLLHNQLHVFSFGNRLSQNNPAAQRRRFRFVQFPQPNFVVAKINHLGSDFATASVEENKLFAALHAQDIARMVGFRSSQHKRVGVPMLRRDVKAVHDNPTRGLGGFTQTRQNRKRMTPLNQASWKNSFARSKKLLRNGVFSSPQSSANSSSFRRCSTFRCDGTSTISRANRSPRPRPLTLAIPFPRSLNICPLCVPGGTFKCALPSSVGTSTSPPKAASEKGIGTSQ